MVERQFDSLDPPDQEMLRAASVLGLGHAFRATLLISALEKARRPGSAEVTSNSEQQSVPVSESVALSLERGVRRGILLSRRVVLYEKASSSVLFINVSVTDTMVWA